MPNEVLFPVLHVRVVHQASHVAVVLIVVFVQFFNCILVYNSYYSIISFDREDNF